ncbi:MAG: hypothetical protein ACLP6G_08040 [Terriglobales bacterium]
MQTLTWNAGTVLIERHSRYWFRTFIACALILLCTVSASFASGAAPGKPGANESDKKVRILLLVDATKPLTVRYESRGRTIWSGLSSLALAPLLIEEKVEKSERSKESQLLEQTVGPFNRKPVIEAGMTAMFKASTPYFEAVVPPDSSAYSAGSAIDFSKALADGYPYVLDVREQFAGMATMWAWSTLSAGSYVQFTLTDSATRKELAKGQTNAFGVKTYEFDPALKDRSTFIADYAAAVAQECVHIYGELYKQGQLHAMAEAHGLGKEVPDTAALLAKYEKLFNYSFTLPAGWHQAAQPSKYVTVLAPKNGDASKVAVSFVMDLLVEELDQKVDNLDDYIRISFARMRDNGYAVDTATPFDGLTLNPPYKAFLVDRPKGAGKEIVLFRRLDDPFVVQFHLLFLADYDDMVKKYGPDLQSLINQTKITTHP